MSEPTARQIAEDYPWALERVTNMCAEALVNARVYGLKLLKGFGYPNETFGYAQDHRALAIVLAELSTLTADLAQVTQERDAAMADATDYIAQVQRAERAEDELAREREALLARVTDRDEVLADMRRLARAIDVAMHGEDGAAKQASLCDLVGPARELRTHLAEALQARDAAHAQIADLQDILNQRQARLEAIEQALAEARKESEWRGEKLQSVAKFAARTALLEAADDAEATANPELHRAAAWLRSRAGDVK